MAEIKKSNNAKLAGAKLREFFNFSTAWLSDMKKLIILYDNASFVATLWCLSPLLPVGLLINDEKVSWMPYAAAAVIFALGFAVSQLYREKRKDNKWLISDTIAYVIIPIGLFSAMSYVFISNSYAST